MSVKALRRAWIEHSSNASGSARVNRLRLAAAAELLTASLTDALLAAAQVTELVGAGAGAVAAALFGTLTHGAVAHQVLALLALHDCYSFFSRVSSSASIPADTARGVCCVWISKVGPVAIDGDDTKVGENERTIERYKFQAS